MEFVDTNILLYSVSKAAGEAEKRSIALKILEAETLAISVQVLQEFYVQATRPTKSERLTPEQATALVESWQRFTVQDLNVAILRAAMTAAQRFQLSYWDAAIIESARALGCKEVLSEDLNAGQSYGGIRVVNPFSTKHPKANGKK